MRKLFAVLATSFLFLTGCVTVPEKPAEEKSGVCQLAEANIATANARFSQIAKDPMEAFLIDCAELTDNVGYFIYGATADIGGIADSGHVRVVVEVRKDENGNWRALGETPFLTYVTPEAMRVLMQRAAQDQQQLDVQKEKDQEQPPAVKAE